MADINAHGRWINSISIDHNILASVGDDCYLRLWQFNEINAKFEVIFYLKKFQIKRQN